jgi:multiple sugar transport system permease protein
MRATVAGLVTAVFALPLVFMVSGSVRRAGEPPPRTVELLPDPIVLGSYGRAFELVDLGRYALNSLLVAAIVAPLSVLVASWAGFAITRLPRRWANALVAASFAALMVPLTALLVPRFAIFRALGLTDTYVPLIAPGLLATSPFYVLVFAWAFRRLPRELYEASRLEGMTPFAIWRRVAMPLVRPVAVGVGVLAFVVSWGNFLDPLVYLFDADLYTLPLGLRSLAQLDRTNFPLLLAGAVVATAPVVAVFLVAQRFFLHEYRGAGWLGR